jgi:transposase InsO family protein
MKLMTTPSQRQEFQRRHHAGETYSEIAAHCGVSKECVRYWCRREGRAGGCESQYQRDGPGPLSEFHALVRYALLRLKVQHPHWGPNRLRVHLRKRASVRGLPLPSEASIGRYLHQWLRFHRRPKKKLETPRPHEPTAVHQCWQIDFKSDIQLTDGTQVTLHTVRDPVGEACLAAKVFPNDTATLRPERVTLEQVRQVLRSTFTTWNTLPDQIQTDGEPVLVRQAGKEAFPNVFTLWLKGLGIEHAVIRPGCPTDNAEVERCHRTLNDYVIVGNEHQLFAGLEAQLDQAVLDLLFDLPSRAQGCTGRPPLEAHPDLLQPRHPFRPEHELALFDLKRVDAYLSTFTWTRKASKNGQISLGGRHQYYSVGRAYAQHTIVVRFDPTDRQFVCYDAAVPDKEIARRPARQLEVADLTGLATWPAGLVPQQLPLPLPAGVDVNEHAGV